MPKIPANGHLAHYITVGHGPDIVMLHGFLGNLAVWHLSIAPVLRREFRVTTYDLRGHGYSEVTPTGYTADDLAQDLKGLLDGLEIERPVLVGHSYGADVAMYFSLLYPERVSRLVAIEPGLPALVHQRTDTNWEGWAYWVSKLEEVGLEVPEDKKSDPEYLLTLSLETPKFYGPARGLPRRREPLINLVRNTSLITDYERVGSLTLDRLSELTLPILLVYGDKSHFLGSYHYLRHALPNSIPELLAGGEHFGPLEQPEVLTEHIRRFASTGTLDCADALEERDWSARARPAVPAPGSGTA